MIDALGLRVIRLTDLIGAWIGMLLLRFILFWEFWESGMTKLTGPNWFGSYQDSFIFPFNLVPANISWEMAVWGELIGAMAILLGIGTRFFAVSLVVVTVVAITSGVHWPPHGLVFSGEGVYGVTNSVMEMYSVSKGGVDGFFTYGDLKLGIMFIVMLSVLIFYGPGRASFDSLVKRIVSK